MKAIIEQNYAKGLFSVRISIINIDPMADPEFIISRVQDRASLTTAGWQKGKHLLSPVNCIYYDKGYVLFLEPELSSLLKPDRQYEIELPGYASCALDWDPAFRKLLEKQKTDILDSELAATQNPPSDKVLDNYALSGSSSSDSGVAAIPDIPMDRTPRRSGCWIWLCVLSLIWILGTWYLWHMSTSQTNATQKSEGSGRVFEIIPGSDERTDTEDGMEDRMKGQDGAN